MTAAMETPAIRRLAAVLAADVAGYSRLMGRNEEETLERLMAHRRALVDPKIAEHRGRIVKTTGDGIVVEFVSVVDAVRCAVEIQRGMAERNSGVLVGERLEFRVGINLSDVIVEGDDIYGDGVNIAARVEALADAGGVFVSNTVYDHVRDRLPFVSQDLGEQQVKNIARPVRVYRIPITENAPAKTPPAGARENVTRSTAVQKYQRRPRANLGWHAHPPLSTLVAVRLGHASVLFILAGAPRRSGTSHGHCNR
jgi:adenylate cyclase